jgi:dihydropyrimidine dehydrogenase (NAD+) subunit PreA
MEFCIKGKIDRPVDIKSIMNQLGSDLHESRDKLNQDKVDLGIEFCGIPCENPFFLSSSVVASNYEMVAKAFEMGWAGAAFKTIGKFVPEEVSPRFAAINKEGNSFIGFKNIEQISDHSFDDNVEFIRRLKEEYPTKIIIASILGESEEEWEELARDMTLAGADIIECNFSCPHMSKDGLGSDVGQNPDLVAMFTKATRRGTHLPILAKMTPNIGNMEIPAIAAMEAGATGIAAINTIKSIMNIGLEDFASEPYVDGKSSVGGYSGKSVKPIALRFINDMKQHPKLKDIPISGMGGIETWYDSAEFIALGCENLQITTSVMQYGYRIIDDLKSGLEHYLLKSGMKSVSDLVGVALEHIVPTDQLNRSSIAYPKFHRDKCIACGRCYLSCRDGGHQAIELNEETKPILNAEKCVGCHLCSVVCPVDAISIGKRVRLT